jgi:hypothetical protein
VRGGGPDTGTRCAGVRLDQGLVVAEILLRHPPRGKSIFEMSAHLPSVKLGKPADRLYGSCFPRYDKAGYAMVDDLRHGTGLEGNDGGAAGHGLDHDETERFWPIDRKKESSRARQKLPLCFIVDLADELDLRPVDLRLKLFLEIFPFASRYLCGDTKRHFCGVRDPDGGLRSFLRREPAQEGKIGAGFEGRPEQVGRQAVVNRAQPVCLTQGISKRMARRESGGLRLESPANPSVHGRLSKRGHQAGSGAGDAASRYACG